MAGDLPFLGVGLSYRWELNPILKALLPHLDWLEVTPEHFLPFTEDAAMRLALLAKKVPVVGHGLELSVGSEESEEAAYRAGLAKVLSTSKAVWHSDHLCFTRAGDLPVRALTPVPFSDEAIEVSVRNIRAIQATLEVPFVVENVAYYLKNPMTVMTEPEFLRKVVTGADCGLLLDLHNVYTNATNFGLDPFAFVEQLPLDRVVQIHLAGGQETEGMWIDSHSSCSPELVWRLLDHVLPRCPVRGVNFEMDSGFPGAARMAEELDRAKAALVKHGLKRAAG